MNKVLGAILGTALVLVALNIASGAIFAPETPAKPGYNIVVPKQATEGQKAEPAAKDPPVEQLLASADPMRGEEDTAPCKACHTFDKGGGTKIGPNLWGVVGRPRASVPGYDYSSAMKAMGGTWTVDNLYVFLAHPQDVVPGTKMTFQGLPRPATRADVIDYLNTLSDHPAQLPTAAAEGNK